MYRPLYLSRLTMNIINQYIIIPFSKVIATYSMQFDSFFFNPARDPGNSNGTQLELPSLFF